jgi:hypothetical protein
LWHRRTDRVTVIDCPTVQTYVDYLAAVGMRAEPGLDAKAVKRLERALGARLPDPVRQLYGECGGLRTQRWTGMPPMRLMRPEEVIEDAEVLRDCADTYSPSAAARYLFTDDSSNWVGVFVRGRLTGKMTILDHEEPEQDPRFRDVSSFLDKLIDAARRGLDWPDMDTDYPLGPDSDETLVAEARPLAHHYLARYRAATSTRKAVTAAGKALHLLPPDEWATLRELLASPHQYVRYMTLKVAGCHRATALVRDIVAYARQMGREDNFTHWLQAGHALLAMGAEPELEALEATANRDWHLHRRP